jgi:hypothetical protein
MRQNALDVEDVFPSVINMLRHGKKFRSKEVMTTQRAVIGNLNIAGAITALSAHN